MVELFQSVAPGGPEAIERKMFGQPAATVHGHMFMGLFGDVFQVRLSDADARVALEAGAAPFAPMGRTMTGYYVLPETILADRAQLTGWIAKAYANAAAFPPKEAKARKSAAKR